MKPGKLFVVIHFCILLFFFLSLSLSLSLSYSTYLSFISITLSSLVSLFPFVYFLFSFYQFFVCISRVITLYSTKHFHQSLCLLTQPLNSRDNNYSVYQSDASQSQDFPARSENQNCLITTK